MTATGQPAASSGPLSNRPRLGDVIVERIEALAAITDEPGQVKRLYLSPAHKRSIPLVSDWMREAGMAVRVDAVGTIAGRYEGATPDAPVLLLGSHIDTVRNAGKYDGTLGVLAAIAAVDRLHSAGRRLPFAIEVLAFGDEEGVRFTGTLTGSRAIAGRFDPRVLDEIGSDGITRRQALAEFGCDVTQIESEARDPANVVGYLEVHIEQGPVLEAEDRPVAVVTAINGASRGTVTVTGMAGHAGTVPMALRRDAMAAAAEMILAVERHAAAEGGLVATVGVLDIADCAANAVPGRVTFSLDIRSPSDDQRRSALAALQADFDAIAAKRSVTVQTAISYDAPSAPSDPKLTSALSRAIAAAGYAVRDLPSGAGHDAMAFKDRIPFAMLFVRCRDGLSHHPDEYATPGDIDIAARILADCVETLA
jgi:allantoate deiminase